MLMITVMSGNSKVYSNVLPERLGTMAAFNSTLAGMAFQFSDMVAKGQSIEGRMGPAIKPPLDLIATLTQQAENIKEIQIETERDSPLERRKARERAQVRRREHQIQGRRPTRRRRKMWTWTPTADAGQITRKRKLGMREDILKKKQREFCKCYYGLNGVGGNRICSL